MNNWKQDIINIYKKDSNYEFEIRFVNITKPNFIKIYNNLYSTNKSAIIEQSLNIMYDQPNSNTSLIKKIILKNDDKNSIQYYEKKQIYNIMTQINDVHNIRIALSTEIKINQKQLTKISFGRAKYRISFNINDNWRLDMTKVKIINYLSNHNLSTIKSDIHSFFKLDFLNILYGNKLEVELEYIGKSSIIIDNLNYVTDIIIKDLFHNVSNDLNYETLLKNISYIINCKLNIYRTNSLKSISNQGITINQGTLKSIKTFDNYYLTDKVDGIRAFIYLYNNDLNIITNTLTILKCSTLMDSVSCLCDCEILNNRIFVFDILIFNNNKLFKDSFSNRITFIPQVVQILNKLNLADKYKFICKDYLLLKKTNINTSIKDFYNLKRSYEIDGLIFNTPNLNYNNTKAYKWKPYEQNTIDFYSILCPNSIYENKYKRFNKSNRKYLYLLFVSINAELMKILNMIHLDFYHELFENITITGNLFPIHFVTNNDSYSYLFFSNSNLYNNKIVELSRNQDNTEWNFIKERTDRLEDLESSKYFGNYYKVADSVWQNYINTVTIDMLSLYNMNESYFQTIKPKKYQNITKYNLFVKQMMLQDIHNKNVVIDLGIGQGADLSRYIVANVKHLIGIDIDKDALTTLNSRMYTILNKYKSQNQITKITTIFGDVCKTEDIINKLIEFNISKVDAVISQFAFHYYLENLEYVVKMIGSLLNKDGYFLMSTFDGQLVYNLLNKNNGEWKIIEDNVIKYHIKRNYSGTFQENGQSIELILPFSDGKYYKELLVNTDYIISIFNKFGMKLLKKQNFYDHIDEYTKLNKKFISNNSDIQFISLYCYLIFIHNS